MQLTSSRKAFLSGIIGAGIGFIGGSVWMLIAWILAGLALGWLASSLREAVRSGFWYGFFLLFCFMVSGYNGTLSIADRLYPFALLGLGGAVGGIFLEVVSFAVRSKIVKADSKQG